MSDVRGLYELYGTRPPRGGEAIVDPRYLYSFGGPGVAPNLGTVPSSFLFLHYQLTISAQHLRSQTPSNDPAQEAYTSRFVRAYFTVMQQMSGIKLYEIYQAQSGEMEDLKNELESIGYTREALERYRILTPEYGGGSRYYFAGQAATRAPPPRADTLSPSRPQRAAVASPSRPQRADAFSPTRGAPTPQRTPVRSPPPREPSGGRERPPPQAALSPARQAPQRERTPARPAPPPREPSEESDLISSLGSDIYVNKEPRAPAKQATPERDPSPESDLISSLGSDIDVKRTPAPAPVREARLFEPGPCPKRELSPESDLISSIGSDIYKKWKKSGGVWRA